MPKEGLPSGDICFRPFSCGGALLRAWLRFRIPLIEPDAQISRIRLLGKAWPPQG
jgi:hypothetical protein